MEPSQLFSWDLTDPETAPRVIDPRPAVDLEQAEIVARLAEQDPSQDFGRNRGASDASQLPNGWELPSTLDEVSAPVLVHALRGSMDAGHAGSLLASHLLSMHPSTRVATFDVDELMDYRSRRPTMTFDKTAFVDYSDPELAVDFVSTPGGGVLLLHGPEPDLRWEKFARALRGIVERLGVTTTVGVHGIPMGVPHTRPISVTAHGTREGLVDVGSEVFGTVQVPGSAASLLELRFGQWGHDAMGFAVHVPHYLAQTEYPAAAAELLRQVSRVTGEELGAATLDDAATAMVADIDKQIADSPEVAAVVAALETQYDAYLEASGRSLLASTDVPTADELGAQFEAFLAEQDDAADGGEPDGSATS